MQIDTVGKSHFKYHVSVGVSEKYSDGRDCCLALD